MTAVYIIVGLIVVAAIAYFLTRKPPAAQLQAPEEKKPLPPKPEKRDIVPPPPPKVTVRDTPAARQETRPAEVIPEAPPSEKPAVPSKRRAAPGDVAGLRKGLGQTRTGFIAKLAALFTGKKEIDPNIVAELEEIMLTSDVGVKTTQSILARIKDGLDKNELKDNDAVWAALRAEATRILSLDSGPITLGKKPTVVLMVGVNGVGKTTTIGKLATKFKAESKKVMLAAGDTFRAAAVQQLEVWGKRVDAEVIKGKEGSDPGAVAFEATTKAKEAGADILFVDTAGRLQTKQPLMDEIKKVRKTIGKALEGGPHETLLVLDATTGQNALSQAALFKEALDLTGIVLTKLDGTAKGGIVLAICDELKVPVRYIGLGERAEDLKEFDPESFVEALFGDAKDEARAA
jgi:fused signal recognition particle receptor